MLGKTRILWVGVLVQIICLVVPILAYAGKDKKKWHRSDENREKRKLQRRAEIENRDGLNKTEREELRQLEADHAAGKFTLATEQDLKNALNNPVNSVIPNLANQYSQSPQVAPLPPEPEGEAVSPRRPTQVDKYLRDTLKVKDLYEFNLTAAMYDKIQKASGRDTPTREFQRKFLSRSFSPSSEKTLG